MKILWWRKDSRHLDEAKEAVATAERQLVHARYQRRRAEEIGYSLREIRRKNHITQTIFPPTVPRKSQ